MPESDLEHRLAEAVATLEGLGWVWKQSPDGAHELSKPSRRRDEYTADPITDLTDRQQALAAVDSRLWAIEDAWNDLSREEQEASPAAAAARSQAISLRIALKGDTPFSSLWRQAEALKATDRQLRKQLEEVEAEVSRFRDAVGRGWAVIVIGFILSYSMAPEMGWRRDDLIFFWIVVAIIWAVIWGRKASRR